MQSKPERILFRLKISMLFDQHGACLNSTNPTKKSIRRNQTKEAEVGNIPQIKVDDVVEADPQITNKVNSLGETDLPSRESDFQQPIKKSLSSWDISHAFNRVLTNKSKNSSSSTSELTLRIDSSDQELKKTKWYTKLGLSSSKSSLDGTAEKSEKKKMKWYKSSKKLATAM